ncbi:hypothetical protein T265_10288 [Opisthorchis viverrini]|uniref:Protoheme IX farnesyltransferase, mitochondrial n=1 Tax=Opisthorchis viverrini TaxID=6198 RepID=A0A075A1U7_OPIVI|nr:hypothetical protein T265_10288 [Opisthorchis viverrini]KER21384.1 hypothetical protein T265_10288 [Opisthorchis viverrini]
MPSKRHRLRSERCFTSIRTDHRASPGSLERLQYLEKLVSEFKETDIHDYKEQVPFTPVYNDHKSDKQIIANLANFAYDPRNCPHLRQLHVVDLFLTCLEPVAPIWAEASTGSESSTVADSAVRLAELALGGLVNLASASPTDRKELRDHPLLAYVVACLASPIPLIVIHCLTILIQLFTQTRGTTAESEFSVDLRTRFPAAIRAAQAYRQQQSSGGDTLKDPRISVLAQLLSAVPSGSEEQAQSKRLGASISQISLTPTSVPRSITDRGIPLESLSVTVGSPTFPEEHSPPSLDNNILYSTTDSREHMGTDPPVTSSVCPILASPDQILVPTFPQSLTRSFEVAAGLSKARLSLLVVSTAVVGCVLAASTSLTSPLFLAHPYRTLLCLIVGTGLTSAAANTVNQIVEIPYDSQMMRTRDRVLVRGLTNISVVCLKPGRLTSVFFVIVLSSPGRAGLFALGCAGTGLITLCLGTNPLVVWLAAGNMLLYTTLYTPLKQFSQANTWIGALVGGVPPLMGWAAATGEIHSGKNSAALVVAVFRDVDHQTEHINVFGALPESGGNTGSAILNKPPGTCAFVLFVNTMKLVSPGEHNMVANTPVFHQTTRNMRVCPDSFTQQIAHSFSSGSMILASLLYVWQFPHFMALSWNLRGEYSKAGYMMTSVLEPPVCKQVALRYAVACSLVCLAGAGCSAISLGPWAGCALGLTCLPPNIGLIYYAWQFSRADSQEGSAAAARRLFRSTLLHLPIVMTAALIGTYICGTTIGAGQ